MVRAALPGRSSRTSPASPVSLEEIRRVPVLKRQQEYLRAKRLRELRMESYPKFQNEVGVPVVRVGSRSSLALGINRRKITHTSTSIWAVPVRSSAPIALRYSVSIRPWAHAKLIRQIVLTVTSTESKGSNAASLVKLPAANHRQTPLSRSVGDVSGEPVAPQCFSGA
jgi:hypothetical protein